MLPKGPGPHGSSACFLEEGVKEGRSLEAAHPMGRARTRDGHTCIWFWLCCPCSKRPTPTCSGETGWSPAGGTDNVPNTQQHPVTATCGLNFLKTTLCFSQRMQIQSQLPFPQPPPQTSCKSPPHVPISHLLWGQQGIAGNRSSFRQPPPSCQRLWNKWRAKEQVLGSLVGH